MGKSEGCSCRSQRAPSSSPRVYKPRAPPFTSRIQQHQPATSTYALGNLGTMESSSKQKQGRAPWRPPRTAFPVFRPYFSQLELIRKRHNEDDNMAKSNRTFWVAWNAIQMRVSKEFANEEWDTQQYEAEVELFKKFCRCSFFSLS